MSNGWRNAALLLGAACCLQLWRDCARAPAEPAAGAGTDRTEHAWPQPARGESSWDRAPAPASGEARADAAGGPRLYGVAVPPWAVWLAPRPGEDARAYRDRMLPLAMTVIAPQRARVARGRDDFAALANLDAHQRAELDAAAEDAANAIEERVLAAIGNDELSPATWKPMAGVALARDLLDTVDRANKRFTGALRDDQRAALARHPFDFADYLVFSTRWEDALKALD